MGRLKAGSGTGTRAYELLGTGVFAENAKATAEDVLVRITVENRGPAASNAHVRW